jgi:hypothetical protein
VQYIQYYVVSYRIVIYSRDLTHSPTYTVKKAVELLGVPPRSTFLMYNKYNLTAEILYFLSYVVFFYPANEQESSTLAQYKKYVVVSD